MLQLCRWKFSHKETLRQIVFDLNWFLSTKITNLLFKSLFGALRDNVSTSSIARWKARSRLPIRDNWTFFASSSCCDVISRLLEIGPFQKGMDHFERKFQVDGDVVHNQFWHQKSRVFCYLTVKTAWSYLHSSGYNTSVWRTDRRTELPWLIQRCALQAMRPRCKFTVKTVLKSTFKKEVDLTHQFSWEKTTPCGDGIPYSW